MSYNHSRIRVRGQRSIPSTFINRTSTDDQLNDGRESLENVSGSKKRAKISLSDFLDRKLQKTSDPSKLVQGKERQFLSPGTSVGAKRSIDGANADEKTEGRELNGILDIVLEQFKHNKENEDNSCFNPEDEVANSPSMHVIKESQIQDLSKRRNAFGGFHGKQPAPKGLVVLGDDPRPKQTTYPKSFIKNEKPLPLYNHYASGSGWWDSDMEGIDNEEVGFNEVWEGVGTATLGGLDWH
ncbi:uncharacterized protein LOC112522251 [Cynara cardunculus var. scolymus]|uniref:Uncharacterized protein n=1 Tax=Cynara cardunculus var. scolymus TaxID=59895 RepID=A0A103XHS0_CYNCS|nr:uncharacterized protein LOC112522251 [Cynara cardunculus var. scolymus]KVH90958.1 hypothetical protein Ccrd_007012 [Cynara cardunculus var. scolymus]